MCPNKTLPNVVQGILQYAEHDMSWHLNRVVHETSRREAEFMYRATESHLTKVVVNIDIQIF